MFEDCLTLVCREKIKLRFTCINIKQTCKHRPNMLKKFCIKRYTHDSKFAKYNNDRRSSKNHILFL